MLSDGGSSGQLFRLLEIPAFLETVVARRAGPLARATARFVQYEGPLCLGYRSPCLPAHRYAAGVELTMLCRDIAPFSEAERPALGPGFREAFSQSPYWHLCNSWPVAPAAADVAQPPASDVPTLVTIGRLAPYSPASVVRPALRGLTAASYVVDPGGAHNVVPRPCVEKVRNAWLESLQPMTANPCAKEEEIPWNK